MRPKNRVQNWWSKELEKLKQSIKEARKDLKINNDINNKIRVKIQKKEFRKDEIYSFVKIIKIKTLKICLVLETRTSFGELSVHTKTGILI